MAKKTAGTAAFWRRVQLAGVLRAKGRSQRRPSFVQVLLQDSCLSVASLFLSLLFCFVVFLGPCKSLFRLIWIPFGLSWLDCAWFCFHEGHEAPLVWVLGPLMFTFGQPLWIEQQPRTDDPMEFGAKGADQDRRK